MEEPHHFSFSADARTLSFIWDQAFSKTEGLAVDALTCHVAIILASSGHHSGDVLPRLLSCQLRSTLHPLVGHRSTL
jgi:hypothetical protein